MMAGVYGLSHDSCLEASYPLASHLPHSRPQCMRVHTEKCSMSGTKAGKESLEISA